MKKIRENYKTSWSFCLSWRWSWHFLLQDSVFIWTFRPKYSRRCSASAWLTWKLQRKQLSYIQNQKWMRKLVQKSGTASGESLYFWAGKFVKAVTCVQALSLAILERSRREETTQIMFLGWERYGTRSPRKDLLKETGSLALKWRFREVK